MRHCLKTNKQRQRKKSTNKTPSNSRVPSRSFAWLPWYSSRVSACPWLLFIYLITRHDWPLVFICSLCSWLLFVYFQNFECSTKDKSRDKENSQEQQQQQKRQAYTFQEFREGSLTLTLEMKVLHPKLTKENWQVTRVLGGQLSRGTASWLKAWCQGLVWHLGQLWLCETEAENTGYPEGTLVRKTRPISNSS